MFHLIATTAAAFASFVKGQQLIYITNGMKQVELGEIKPALKIGKTTNAYQRLRAYITLSDRVCIEIYEVDNAEAAEAIMKHTLKDYSLGRELYTVDALELARKTANELKVC